MASRPRRKRWRGRAYTHATKYQNRVYRGTYGRDVDTNDRTFLLIFKLKSGKEHVIAFESQLAAKEAGWSPVVVDAGINAKN